MVAIFYSLSCCSYFLSTSIVMTASISSALELKMAGQFNEKNEVFRAAERALNQVASSFAEMRSRVVINPCNPFKFGVIDRWCGG